MMVARTEEQLKQFEIKCKGQQLKQVGISEYLGTVIHHIGKIQGEIQVLKQTQKTTNAYYSLNRCIFGKGEVDKKQRPELCN